MQIENSVASNTYEEYSNDIETKNLFDHKPFAQSNDCERARTDRYVEFRYLFINTA